VVAPMRLTIVSWSTSGFPRQFMLMWENRRCSILFHLLVPGGRCEAEADARTVAAPTVGGDQELGGVGAA